MPDSDEPTRNGKASNRSESGITLIELMVTLVISGILAAAMVQIIRQTSEAMKTNRKISNVLDNLRSASQLITNNIRTVGRSADDSGAEYRLIGVDGDGDEFEDSDTETERVLSGPNNADHLHLHAEFPHEASGDTRLFCIYLNDGTHRFLEDSDGDGNNEWGVLKRDTWVDRDDYFSDGDDYNAVNISKVTGDTPIGYNIDYLSFRYYDADHGGSGQWFNAWNSHDTSLTQIE
ncbi:MAG: PilW family protein, partial [bacterium]